MLPDNPEEKPERQVVKKIIDWLKQKPKLLLASLFLIIIGFLGGIIANIEFFQLLFSIGLFLLLIWGFQRLAKHPPRFLKREQVLESWSILIKNAQGRDEVIFKDTQELINESKAPDIEMEHQSIAPSIIKGIVGEKREFLVIRNHTNRNLKTYQMYINARDYGNNLHVSWYLVSKLGFWRTLLAIVLFFIAREPRPETLMARLNLFDQQDLIAYVTNAHHCLIEAVEKLMLNLGQDPSKIERKSRGFLGIS
jgi:hypothetical protein